MLDMLFHVFSNRKKVDYVIIDTYSTLAFWYAYLCGLLCFFLKIKYIPILHGGNLEQRFKTNPKMCKMFFGNAYANVAPSNYLFEKFKNYNLPCFKIIPNTIEIENYAFKKRLTISPKILWVRSFSIIYNPKMALEVLKMIKNDYPDASLTMVGPFKDIDKGTVISWANSLNIEVNLTGKLCKSDWINMSSEYDIFINTTNFDNTPVSVMEAMAVGIPIVSTNVGGIPFLLTNSEDAILVPSNDIVAMTKAISELIHKPQMANRLTMNARRKVEQFDWQIVKESWKRLLQ